MTVPFEIRRKVIVRAPNWVGDAVMATPALRLLRRAFFDSHITLLARPWVAAVFEHNPDINDLWVHDDSASTKEFWSTVRRIRAERFDFGIAMPNSFRSAALLRFGGVKNRIGHAHGPRNVLLTKKIEVAPELLEGHQVYFYRNLVEWLCDGEPETHELVLVSGSQPREEVARILDTKAADHDALRVGIAPGAINSDAKLWLADRFADLADRLSEVAGAEVILLGSEKERAVLDQVESLCRRPVRNLAGKINLGQLIALMEGLDAFIGNDSGAMHIAAAFRVPTVAIFGPTEWKTTSPFSPNATIVRHPVDCAPCMLRKCPLPDHPCMTGVSVDNVLETLFKLAPRMKRRMKAAGAVGRAP